MQILEKIKEAIKATAGGRWSTMTFYERFEQIIAIILSAVISVIIAISLLSLINETIYLFLFHVDPLSHQVFQRLFGMIMTVLIAMEFNHSIIRAVARKEGVIQVKTVVLIAILTLARKFIILDFETISTSILIGMGVAVLALGVVYWLIREQSLRLERKASEKEG